MTGTRKRIAAVLLAGFLLFSSAAAEKMEIEEISLGEAPVVTEKDGYHFDARGFLTGENPEEAYLLEDAENGNWQYATEDLSIRVTRFREPSDKYIREYCVAEVYASEKSPLFTIMTPARGKRAPGYSLKYAEDLVAANPVVLAVSDDFYGYRHQRILNHGATWPVGIIVRNGALLYKKTRNSSKKRPFPPMDTLAVYADGSMKVRISDEIPAEQYVEDGATQVFSFGPWLIREGEINAKEASPEAVYLNYSEPRCAAGMVEPYHYVFVVVGVPDDKGHIGAKGDWLIAKMQEYGCTEALNLDGGGTACMVFNGKVILQGRFKKERRPLGSMIAFGPPEASEQEQPEE